MMPLSLSCNSTRAGRLRTRRPVATAAVLLIVLAGASIAPASNESAYLVRSSSGMVFFEIWLTGPLPNGLVFWLPHEAEAIDFVRRGLVRQGKIQNLPIVVAPVFDASKPNRVSLLPGCDASEGQGGGRLIGRCYVIVYRDVLSPERRDLHQDLLALAVSLPGLSAGRVGTDFDDLDAVRAARADEIAPFKGIVHHFDPIWSPDGTRLIYTVWESGRIRFELLEPSSRTVTRLESLCEYMAVRPIWSDDSRFVAYGSLQSVKVFDTHTQATRTFRRGTSSSEMRTTILFEGTQLHVAFRDMSTGGEIFDYDAVRGNLQKSPDVPSGAGEPEWVRRAERYTLAVDRHASLSPVRSPTRQYAAIFTFVDGQRRIELKALR